MRTGRFITRNKFKDGGDRDEKENFLSKELNCLH